MPRTYAPVRRTLPRSAAGPAWRVSRSSPDSTALIEQMLRERDAESLAPPRARRRQAGVEVERWLEADLLAQARDVGEQRRRVTLRRRALTDPQQLRTAE